MELLKALGVISVMTLIIPIYIWGNTGSWRHALHALKWYCIVMALLILPGLLVAGVTLLPLLF